MPFRSVRAGDPIDDMFRLRHGYSTADDRLREEDETSRLDSP
jgi:hypothetical protein